MPLKRLGIESNVAKYKRKTLIDDSEVLGSLVSYSYEIWEVL